MEITEGPRVEGTDACADAEAVTAGGNGGFMIGVIFAVFDAGETALDVDAVAVDVDAVAVDVGGVALDVGGGEDVFGTDNVGGTGIVGTGGTKVKGGEVGGEGGEVGGEGGEVGGEGGVSVNVVRGILPLLPPPPGPGPLPLPLPLPSLSREVIFSCSSLSKVATRMQIVLGSVGSPEQRTIL